MKMRAIVWTVVGLLVVVGVVFMLSARRRSPAARLTAEELQSQVTMVEGKLAGLEQDIAMTRAKLPPGSDPAVFAPVEQAIMDARNMLDEAKRADKPDAGFARLKDARKQLADATRLFKKATRPPRPAGR
jgi:hypothetical protein